MLFRSTHETRTKHQRELETTTEKHSPPPNEHESSVKGLTARTFHRDGRPDDDGRRTTTTTTTHKFARRALATGESSRARSFARSHARTQRKRKRNRNRFPGSGVGLKPAPHPQPPIRSYFMLKTKMIRIMLEKKNRKSSGHCSIQNFLAVLCFITFSMFCFIV